MLSVVVEEWQLQQRELFREIVDMATGRMAGPRRDAMLNVGQRVPPETPRQPPPTTDQFHFAVSQQ